jgi:hypothetical protein
MSTDRIEAPVEPWLGAFDRRVNALRQRATTDAELQARALELLASAWEQVEGEVETDEQGKVME